MENSICLAEQLYPVMKETVSDLFKFNAQIKLVCFFFLFFTRRLSFSGSRIYFISIVECMLMVWLVDGSIPPGGPDNLFLILASVP